MIFSRLLNAGMQSIFVILVLLMVALFVALLLSMFFDVVEVYLSGITGIAAGSKLTLLHTLGIALGGAFIGLQALASHRRAIAMEQAANAQAQATKEQTKANLHIEQGRRQDRLKNAIEHLGHKSASVRLAGAYELFHLARETEPFRERVFDILCSHIRQTTTEANYINIYLNNTSPEIQSILALVFANSHDTFEGLKANLQGSCLNRANLMNLRLVGANLEGAQLQLANLHQAQLQGSRLLNVNFCGALIMAADLSGSAILSCMFQRSLLTNTRFMGCTIIGSNMQLADARGAYFQGSRIESLKLQAADLRGADFRGTTPVPQMKGDGDSISMTYEDNVRAAIDRNTDLSKVVLTGGMTEKEVALIINGLTEEEASRIRDQLSEHIERPENYIKADLSEAIVGSYTREQAESWIKEFKKLVPTIETR